MYRGTYGGEPAAIKVLSLDKNTSAEVQREISLMRACDCAQIVSYRDAFRRMLDGRMTLHVVMELAEHGSTLDVIRQRGFPMPEGATAWICKGVLQALKYMHTVAKVIHRDVKAANVLLMSGGAVKLADLGVAAQLQRTMSKRGTMIGTPHWMAPEAFVPDDATGAAGVYDARVDVWSLGITAIELAEGLPPHADNKLIFQVMMRIANDEPPRLKSSTRASAAFHAFLAAALVKSASDRPAAGALLEDAFVAAAGPSVLASVLEAARQQELLDWPQPPSAAAAAAAAARMTGGSTLVLSAAAAKGSDLD